MKVFEKGDIVYLPCSVEEVYVEVKAQEKGKHGRRYYRLATEQDGDKISIKPLISEEGLVSLKDFKKV